MELVLRFALAQVIFLAEYNVLLWQRLIHFDLLVLFILIKSIPHRLHQILIILAMEEGSRLPKSVTRVTLLIDGGHQREIGTRVIWFGEARL